MDQLDKAYLDTFSSNAGQEVLEDLFYSYFECPMFNPNLTDPLSHLAFREGQRSVILHIRAAMRNALNPDGPESRVTLEEMIK